MNRSIAWGVAALMAFTQAAWAKLPPPSPEAEAKAKEAAAKSAWQGKVDGYRLCQAQDRVAAYYRSHLPAGKTANPPAAGVAPCTDPGPFAYTPPEQKPAEAAGAHSPPGTAVSAPSQLQAQAGGAPSAPASAASK